ncbi:MAG: hypothetical protein R3182_14955, partial [Draconibacterium sp.]|nr:hypothetical protein [Draconibacterium sp.]
VEEGPEGDVPAEFKENYGYDMITTDKTNNPWFRDMMKIMKELHIVTNNGPESIGGGGEPLQPLAPDFIPFKKISLKTDGTYGAEVYPSGTIYRPKGSNVTLSVETIPAGFEFAGWTGDISSQENSLKIKVNEDLNVEAVFNQVNPNSDTTPPGWNFVSNGPLNVGTFIACITTENATVYVVSAGTPADTSSIKNAALVQKNAIAYTSTLLPTSDLLPGDYILYAIDGSFNISEASRPITLNRPVSADITKNLSDVSIRYHPASKVISVQSNQRLRKIDVYNILGEKLVGNTLNEGYISKFESDEFSPGIYLVRLFNDTGFLAAKKILL